MLELKQIARDLGGELSGGQILCPGPNHSRQDRSLAVRLGKSGEILVHSFAGDDWRECRDFVAARLGIAGRKPRAQIEPWLDRNAEDPQARELALKLWADSADAHGTLAESYLRNRCLELPEGDCSQFMRFHKSCPFGKERYPALIALTRGIENDLPQAVQRTALSHDGTCIRRNGKTLRMSLGPMGGGVIKIDAGASVNGELRIGEGLESTLAGRQMGYAPAWAALSKGGIAKFPVLPSVQRLTIFMENDVNGGNEKAAVECGRRWFAAGRKVFTLRSEMGNDLNDELMEAARGTL